MNGNKRSCARRALLAPALAAAGVLWGSAAAAQGTNSGGTGGGSGTPGGSAGAGGSIVADPNPYYIGAGEAITHDSNVNRVPSGPSDNYSSTSLFGGFDQPIGRQRVYGRAGVSLNRYQDQTQLNNTSYNGSAGLDWATLYNLAGSLNVAANRSLAAPIATTNAPTTSANITHSESIDGSARWGGAALLSIDATAGYSRNNFSGAAYQSGNSRQNYESIGGHYHPGGPLRVGLAARFTNSDTPNAFVDATSGTLQANSVSGKNLDLLADYDLSGLLSANARLSYTKQSSSSIVNSNFSGITGSVSLNWRPTGRTSVSFDASHDAGYDTGLNYPYPVVPINGAPAPTPVAGLYENNRLTNSAGLNVNYSVSAKINATAGVRYTRANVVITNLVQTSGQTAPTSNDVLKTASLGASYAITRNWSAGCNYAHESRDVSGGVAFSYSANTIGCSTQITLR